MALPCFFLKKKTSNAFSFSSYFQFSKVGLSPSLPKLLTVSLKKCFNNKKFFLKYTFNICIPIFNTIIITLKNFNFFFVEIKKLDYDKNALSDESDDEEWNYVKGEEKLNSKSNSCENTCPKSLEVSHWYNYFNLKFVSSS